MERTIISHNTTTGIARIRFEHQGVTLEQNFSLKDVIPSSRYVFSQMGIEIDETYQLKALDALEASITLQIEEGVITNPPEPETPPAEEPEPESEPTGGE